MVGASRGLFALRIAFVAMVGCALLSCAAEPINPANAWITGEPKSEGWTPVAEDRVIDLPAGTVQNAIAQLEDQSAIPLDRDMFARIVRYRTWPSDSKLTPYLVRGVAREDPLGSIHVLQNGSELLMEYDGPIVRANDYRLPMVVLLPSPPTKVFVAVILYS
jgi:hypothetical protein